jgi:hypothetical protein
MQIRAAKYFFCLFIILFSASVSPAEQESTINSELQSLRRQVTELQQALKDANDRHSSEIKMLKEEIELLKQNQNKVAIEVNKEIEPNKPRPELAATQYETKPLNQISQGFNPDISAIGDMIFHGGPTPKGETPGTVAGNKASRVQLREAEFGFSNPVDPYGRADLILSVERQANGEYNVDIEEGYFTFTGLPYDLQAKAGKFYSAFGKANMMHTHAMPWVDRPNVINKFFGEEGLNDGGAEISWLVPNPWNNYMQLSVDIQNNGNETSFGGTQGNGLMYVTHLKNFFDLNRDSTLELGGSFATGSNSSNSQTNIEGLDLTYKWRNPQQGLYKSVTWMNELLFSQRGQEDGGTVNAKGWYSSLEYQFARRWSVFGRYDYTEFPDNSSLHENSYSTGLTFRQSEFMFWRLQFEHTNGDNYAGNVNRNELLLQADFLIGQHPAHQY